MLPGKVPLKLDIAPSSKRTMLLARNETTPAFEANDAAIPMMFSAPMRMSPEIANEPSLSIDVAPTKVKVERTSEKIRTS